MGTSRRSPLLLLTVILLSSVPAPCLAQGAGSPDPLARDLLKAIQRENAAEVERLIDAGAQVTGDAFFMAVSAGPDMARLLVARGADPNSGESTLDMPLLAFFAGSGDVEKVHLLLELGADPNLPTQEGGPTPLIMAAMQNRAEVAEVLLAAGADPSAETAGGDSAMEWAAATGLLTGDTQMAQMLAGGSAEGEDFLLRLEAGFDVDGTHQDGFQSLSKDQTIYDAGGFTGPCLSRRNPTFDPAKPKPGDAGSGAYRETHVRFLGGMKVGMIAPPACEPIELAPAEYEVTVLGADMTWVWKCDPDSGDNCFIVMKDQTTLLANHEFQVGVNPAPAEGAASPDDECRVESVKITGPGRGDPYAYDDSPTGTLEFTAKAQAEPSTCDQPMSWSIEGIGSISAQVEAGGDSATFTYRQLPHNNEDFGPKVITVQVGGRTDTLSVEMFFNPTAFNHPGSEGTPNWFHYWSKTLAGAGETLRHTPQRFSETVSGASVQGQYDFSEDIVYLTDLAYQRSCARRPAGFGGGEMTGIDCFAELVRHEGQHKKERHAWWGGFDPKAGRENAEAACSGTLLSLCDAWQEYKTNHDWDLDLVPNSVEQSLAASRGCDWEDNQSCSGRPGGKIDLEMNAYNVGWGWIPGGANKEDWSRCGKQWPDATVCPGGRIW